MAKKRLDLATNKSQGLYYLPMRILLIEPNKMERTIGSEDLFMFEPLALEYIAAGVTDNHDVRVLDMRIDKALEQALEDFRPDIVGITSYTSTSRRAKEIAGRIKAINRKILTIIGGHHATVAPSDFYVNDIDIVVIGHGIDSFREIAIAAESGSSFDRINGLAIKSGEKWILTGEREDRDLDSYPFPVRKLTNRYRHNYFFEYMRPMASIKTSQGCFSRCNFCSLWRLTKGRYITRSPESILEELKLIQEENIFFADDESMADTNRMMSLALVIRESGIRKRYFLHARSDTIVKSPELFEAWKDIGLSIVFVGIESHKDRDLAGINKGTTTRINEEAVRILDSAGIDIYATFMIDPGYIKEDFRSLAGYIRDLRLKFPRIFVLTPLPGTGYYEEVKDKLITKDTDLIDFVHTHIKTSLPLKTFYCEYARLCLRSLSLASILKFLFKFRLRDILPTIYKIWKVRRRIRLAYLDYG
ncbi:MAG TPA: radical SAM protein [Nitrospiria bacterium]|nr:radical SAM protein [Nitrospiria bacterium]